MRNIIEKSFCVVIHYTYRISFVLKTVLESAVFCSDFSVEIISCLIENIKLYGVKAVLFGMCVTEVHTLLVLRVAKCGLQSVFYGFFKRKF